MVYCTLGVHFTEKKLVPGGAHLGKKTHDKAPLSTFTNHTQCGVPVVGEKKQQVEVQLPPGLRLTV